MRARKVSTFKFEILKIQSQHNYSRLFVTDDLVENHQNQEIGGDLGNIVLFPLESRCTYFLVGKVFDVHLLMLAVDFNVRIVSNNHDEPSCKTHFVKIDWYFKVFYKLPIIYYGVLSGKPLAVYEILSVCPSDCKCILSYNKLTTKCSNETSEIFLTCDPNTAGLSFNMKNIYKMNSDAFWCFKSLRKLLLETNGLEVLPKDIFSELKDLRILSLAYIQPVIGITERNL